MSPERKRQWKRRFIILGVALAIVVWLLAPPRLPEDACRAETERLVAWIKDFSESQSIGVWPEFPLPELDVAPAKIERGPVIALSVGATTLDGAVVETGPSSPPGVVLRALLAEKMRVIDMTNMVLRGGRGSSEPAAIQIHASTQVRWSRIVDALEAAREAGFSRVSFWVENKRELEVPSSSTVSRALTRSGVRLGAQLSGPFEGKTADDWALECSSIGLIARSIGKRPCESADGRCTWMTTAEFIVEVQRTMRNCSCGIDLELLRLWAWRRDGPGVIDTIHEIEPSWPGYAASKARAERLLHLRVFVAATATLEGADASANVVAAPADADWGNVAPQVVRDVNAAGSGPIRFEAE